LDRFLDIAGFHIDDRIVISLSCRIVSENRLLFVKIYRLRSGYPHAGAGKRLFDNQ